MFSEEVRVVGNSGNNIGKGLLGMEILVIIGWIKGLIIYLNDVFLCF